jgi:hypothetical protein
LRLIALLVLVAWLLLRVAGPAAAHPALVTSSPGVGYAPDERSARDRAVVQRAGEPGGPAGVDPCGCGRGLLGRTAGVQAALLAAVVLVAAAVTTVTPVRLVPVSALLAAPVGPKLRTADRVAQVSWPVVPVPELLARVQTAMGARSMIDTVETVTSGFGVDLPFRSRRTGQCSWPPSRGLTAAPRTRRCSSPGDSGLRAAGARLPLRDALDAADRVVSERIVTPNHLLTREYRYP